MKNKLGWIGLSLLAACSPSKPIDPTALVDLNQSPELRIKGWAKNDAWLAQGPAPKTLLANWFNKDSTLDGNEGVSSDKVYAAGNTVTPAKPIVVAVVDSGVDIKHPDLQGKIWTNSGEIPDNGIDDDGNGFVDDVHGWNFLGKVDMTTMEVTREYARMSKLRSDAGTLSEAQEKYYNELVAIVPKKKSDAEREFQSNLDYRKKLEYYYVILRMANVTAIPFQQITKESIAAIQSDIPAVKVSQQKMLSLFADIFKDKPNQSVLALDAMISRNYEDAYVFYNADFDPRKELLKDNPAQFLERGYGDANVSFGSSSHGTHVAGIIAADRKNGIGIQGVAQDVLIMPVRAVPDGDEYDKDIANAIHYAVDNGANIISMSFGKGYSPEFTQVQEAFGYAASKNVLIVHAAGNEDTDIDVTTHFPTRVKNAAIDEQVPGWIEVGASFAFKDATLPAKFSNYGKLGVDLFAPGVYITSTVSYGNGYDRYSGTSMATPVVSGVAALLLSQKPGLSAVELKDQLLKTVTTYSGLTVLKPSIKNNPGLLFSDLSRTGGIVNAFNALAL